MLRTGTVAGPPHEASVGAEQAVENHEHILAIYFMYYNFCRVHCTLRTPPAMEVGLATDQWMI